MSLLQQLQGLFFREHTASNGMEKVSLFDKLRNVFFDAMYLSEDLDKLKPQCDCQDAVAHLEGRCPCADTVSGAAKSGTVTHTGCFARLERLDADIRWVKEALRRGKEQLQPEEETDELKQRLSLIEKLTARLGAEVGKMKTHMAEFQAACSNETLQRIKGSGADLRRYASDLFRTLSVGDHVMDANTGT